MAKTKIETPTTYEFTLILSGQTELTERIHDALDEAGCDDATLGSRCGVIYLDFSREAGTLREAIASAIADVAKANVGLDVVRVEPDELVTAAEIARRIGQSKESVRLHAVGKRGPGGFPPPLTGVTQKTPLYRWSDVVCWGGFKMAEGEGAETLSQGSYRSTTEIRTIGAVNAVLELRRYVSDDKEARMILREVPMTGRKMTGG